MSNTNNNLQTQTSNALYNAIMKAGGKDHPPMLAPAIERLKQGESINVEDLETNLYWEYRKFTSRDDESLESYYSRGKAIVNSPLPTYDQEHEIVAEDDALSNEKEIDKLMELISLSFKKIYKPTNNNLRTSSNTSRANQDNTPRIKKGTGYDNQRVVNVAEARENVGTQVVQQSGIQCYNCKEYRHVAKEYQELEAHYLYMTYIQEVTLDSVDKFRPIFNVESLQQVQNDDKNYNVFVNDREHPEQLESVNATHLKEHGDTNITIDPLDMSINGGEADQDEDENLAKEPKTNQLMFKDLKKLQAELDRPQLKSNRLEDRVMHNNSQGKKQQVEDHRRIFKFSNNKTSITACNDSLNAKTLNVNFVCVTCGKCMLNDNHDMSVLNYINGVNSSTKQPIVVPISTRETKRTVNQSIATPLKRTVATESTTRNLKAQLGSKMSRLVRHVNGGTKSRTTNISEPTTLRKSTVSNTLLSYNSFASRRNNSIHCRLWLLKAHDGNLKLLSNFVEKFLGTVKFGNDQIAPIIGYGDLVQGNVTIKRGFYVEGLNHNLFFVGQFCDADLEVAFQKSTCYIRDLKGNDLLT
nr:hypothetical protein [Tanacetum cinerariifolium]